MFDKSKTNERLVEAAEPIAQAMHQGDPERDAHREWWKAQAIGVGAALGLALTGAVASSMRRLHASRSTPKTSNG